VWQVARVFFFSTTLLRTGKSAKSALGCSLFTHSSVFLLSLFPCEVRGESRTGKTAPDGPSFSPTRPSVFVFLFLFLLQIVLRNSTQEVRSRMVLYFSRTRPLVIFSSLFPYEVRGESGSGKSAPSGPSVSPTCPSVFVFWSFSRLCCETRRRKSALGWCSLLYALAGSFFPCPFCFRSPRRKGDWEVRSRRSS